MTTLPSWSKKRRAPALFLAGAVLAFHAATLLAGRSYAGHDFRMWVQPRAEEVQAALAAGGALPFWNFNEYAGTPFLGTLLEGYFYPPNVLLGVLPPSRAFETLVLLHLWLAAFGMYRLARSYRLSREASALAGLAYSLSLSIAARAAAGHYSMIATISQTPLALLLVRRCVDDPKLFRALLLSLVVALAVVSGHAPFVYQFAILVAATAGVELFWIRQDHPKALRAVGLLAGAAVGAALLSAAHLLPAFEVRRFATRGELSANVLHAEHPPDWSFLLRDATTFWIPLYPRQHFVRGNLWDYYWHEKAVYIGLLPLALAGIGAVAGRRDRAVQFWAAVSLLAVADGMARTLPLHGWLTAILPGYHSFRVPARSVWVVPCMLALLAGYGWDARLRGASTPRARVAIPLLFAGAGLLVALVQGLKFGTHPELGLFLGVLLGAAGLLAASLRPGKWIAAGVLLFSAVDLGAQSSSVQPRPDPADPGTRPWYLDALGPDPGAYRVLDLAYESSGSTPMSHGVRLMEGQGYPLLRETRRLYASAFAEPPRYSFDHLGAGSRVIDPAPLDLLNVGWVVAEEPFPEAGLVEIARRDGQILYRRPGARPYAWRGTESVSAERGIDCIRIRVPAGSSGTLVISESWMPGWNARVDGRPAPVQAYEGALLSLELPEGARDVELRYRPSSFVLGAVLSAAMLAVTVLLLAGLYWTRRRVSA